MLKAEPEVKKEEMPDEVKPEIKEEIFEEPKIAIKAKPIPVPSLNAFVQPKILSAQGISKVTQDANLTFYGVLGTDEDGNAYVIGLACPTYRAEGFEKYLRTIQNVAAPKPEKEKDNVGTEQP